MNGMLAAYLTLLRRNRNYRLLWLAQIVSELGDWFYTLAVYNLLLDLTGSKAQAVGLAVVLQVLPSTFAAPTAGVLNDRISRKRIMIGADVARFFIVLGMLLVRTPSDRLAGLSAAPPRDHRRCLLRTRAQLRHPQHRSRKPGARRECAGLHHLVLLPRRRRIARRNRRRLAGTRCRLRAQCLSPFCSPPGSSAA